MSVPAQKKVSSKAWSEREQWLAARSAYQAFGRTRLTGPARWCRTNASLASERLLRVESGTKAPSLARGLRFPDGEHTITAAANDRLCRLVQAPPLPAGPPIRCWAHLATHIGKGLTFTEFAEIVGAPVDAGYLFGGGSLDFWEPIRLDTRYLVRGGIATVVSRVGRRTGPFDVITTELDLIDAERERAGQPVARVLHRPEEDGMSEPVPGTELAPFTMEEIELDQVAELMELMEDMNPVHTDYELAARLGLRGPVAQGPASLAYVINMLVGWRGDAFLERLEFRFQDTVTVGDTATARGTVRAVDGERSSATSRSGSRPAPRHSTAWRRCGCPSRGRTERECWRARKFSPTCSRTARLGHLTACSSGTSAARR